jgi:hypothetical protein
VSSPLCLPTVGNTRMDEEGARHSAHRSASGCQAAQLRRYSPVETASGQFHEVDPRLTKVRPLRRRCSHGLRPSSHHRGPASLAWAEPESRVARSAR